MKITEHVQNFEKMFAFNQAREIEQAAPKKYQKPELKEAKLQNSQLSELEQDKLESATSSIKKYMDSMGVKLEFEIYKESGTVQVKVLDPENEKVIREIPPDEILDLAESIEEMVGLFVNRNL